jgi:hypothetical protein
MTQGQIGDTNDLVASWHLDGNSIDSGHFGNNGTDTAITYSLSNGKFGQGAGFNGTTSRIVMTDAISLKPTGNFTVGGWFKTLEGASLDWIFQSYNSASSKYAGFNLYLFAGQIIFNSCKNTGTLAGTDFQSITSTNSYANGAWHWAVAVWDGSYLNLYVDGSSVATRVAWANAPVYQATNYVGVGMDREGGGTQYSFNGNLDEVTLYSRNLSAKEIKDLYTWSLGRRTFIA